MATAIKCGKKRRKIDQEAIVKVNSILSDFPHDAIVEILSGLPVKDVVRFRCVCKSWDSMISGHQFAKFHSYKRPCLFFIGKDHILKVGYQEELENINKNGLIPNHPTTMYPSYVVTIPGFNRRHRLLPPALMCSYNGLGSHTFPELLGSCNGLMCLLTPKGTMLVWNPCTGKFKNLPKLSDRRSLNFFWFGYDKSVDDYKLVVSVYYEGHDKKDNPESSVHVLTLKSNSWRELITKDVNFRTGESYLNPAPGCGTLLAGTVHWFVNCREESESFIAAFDLSTEKFKKLLKPVWDHRANIKSTIGELGGCLFLCSYFYGSQSRQWLQLWIMKEYGVISSWTKLATVPNLFIYDSFNFNFTPLYFSKEDEIVALLRNKRCGEAWIGRLNTTDLSFHKLLVLAVGLFGYASIVDMESLVSVDAEKQLNQKTVLGKSTGLDS